jgi:predicted amidohydrolase
MIARRRFVQLAASAVGAAGLSATAHGATEPAPLRYRAAVLRVPVEIPVTAAALEATRRRNAEAMVAAIDAVMQGPGEKPRVLVFPVLQFTSARRAVSGVPMSAVAVDLVSEPLEKTIFAPVVAACRRHRCYVATSTQEKVPQMPGVFFHTGFVVGPDGLVLRSPKAQAQSAPEVAFLRDIADDYRRIFGPDSIMPVADTPIGRLACFVEGEAEVLEASRLLASKGAQLILHTSMENDDTPWLALKQAIGFQCHVFLLTGATSRLLRADRAEPEWMGGSATIVGPDGRVLAAKAGRDEGVAAADIDLAAIEAARKKFGRNTVPAWGLYSELYKPR